MAASPDIDTVTTNVETELEAVSGIGNVYPRNQKLTRPDDISANDKDTTDDRIRVWEVDVRGPWPIVEDEAGFLFLHKYQVVVEGWTATDEATPQDAAWRDLVRDVVSKLKGNTNVFGTAPIDHNRALNVTIDKGFRGDILCHHALIEFEVEATETSTT